jgi:benzoylsuccinyl-CoA thiolase BbsB subunit
MGEKAAAAALKDAGMNPRQIDAIYVGNVFGGMLVGQRICHGLGLSGVPTFNVENACASSSTAFHLAWQAISSGRIDTALVIGTENLSKLGRGTLPLNREDFEVAQGLIMPAVYAMRAQRFLMEWDCDSSVLAAVSVKNRSAGALNANACFQSPVTLEEVLGSRVVADPLTLLMCCANADGAAAAVLCASEISGSIGISVKRVYVRASVSVSGRFENGPYDLTADEITERAARLAYEASGIGPEDLNVVELHDAFAISELIYYEALGLVRRGESVAFLESGLTRIGGKVAVNPSGGLLSRGHPIGATGVAQIVELVRQLRGTAGPLQHEGARVGLAHCTGGGIARTDHAACTVHILSC